MADELIYLRGSPWSLKSVWTSHLMGLGDASEQLTFTEFNPYQQFILKYRLPKNSGPITIPVLFPGDETPALRSSDLIAQHLYKKVLKSGNPKGLDLKICDEEVKKWDEKSNEAMRFARGKTMEMDDVIPYLVPSFMTYIPGLVRLICYLQNKHFISKYGEGDYKITLSSVEKSLSEANDRLEKAEFLVGDSLSYADVSFVSMLESMSPEDYSKPLTVAAPAYNTHKFFRKLFEDKYKNLIPWKSKIMKKYMLDSVVENCTPTLNRKLVPPT